MTRTAAVDTAAMTLAFNVPNTNNAAGAIYLSNVSLHPVQAVQTNPVQVSLYYHFI